MKCAAAGVAVALCALVLSASASALPHARLVTPAGGAVQGPWQRWVDQSKVPTVAGSVEMLPVSACVQYLPGVPLPPSCAWDGVAPSVAVALEQGARDSLYFELGHEFDFYDLKGYNRRYLADDWGDRGVRWDDSQKAIDNGAEDGLEAMFAVIYADCAEGQNDEGADVGIFVPEGLGLSSPVAQPTINTCAYIRRVALRRDRQIMAVKGTLPGRSLGP